MHTLTARWKRHRALVIVPRLLLVLWAAAVLLVGSYLLAGHLLTLPKPESADERLAAGIARVRTPQNEGRWLALHVLYTGCGCSKRVLDHLVSRGASSFAIERVVLVGGDDAIAARVRAAGYQYEAVTDATLESQYGVAAAPLLVIADPTNAVRYVGGYTDRKQSEKIQDEEMFALLAKGETPSPLPVFGCAVAKKLQDTVDPLGLRR